VGAKVKGETFMGTVETTETKEEVVKKETKATPKKKPAAPVKKEKATALLNVEKKDVVTQFGKNAEDTGSAAVQIALITKRINHLTEHLKTHKQDKHSRRGLMKLVGQRRGLLNYLEKTDLELFRKIKKDLDIR